MLKEIKAKLAGFPAEMNNFWLCGYWLNKERERPAVYQGFEVILPYFDASGTYVDHRMGDEVALLSNGRKEVIYKIEGWTRPGSDPAMFNDSRKYSFSFVRARSITQAPDTQHSEEGAK